MNESKFNQLASIVRQHIANDNDFSSGRRRIYSNLDKYKIATLVRYYNQTVDCLGCGIKGVCRGIEVSKKENLDASKLCAAAVKQYVEVE